MEIEMNKAILEFPVYLLKRDTKILITTEFDTPAIMVWRALDYAFKFQHLGLSIEKILYDEALEIAFDNNINICMDYLYRDNVVYCILIDCIEWRKKYPMDPQAISKLRSKPYNSCGAIYQNGVKING